MKIVDPTPSQRDIQLLHYVDGKLDDAQRQALEATLAEQSDQQQRLQDWQTDQQRLRAAYPLTDEIPERLRRTLAQRRRPVTRIAAALAWLALGVAIGQFVQRPTSAPSPTQALTREAAFAHAVFVPEVKHPVEVTADQEEHLVRWLSKRLGTNVKAPHLAEQGFNLVGGRLLASDTGPVAQFMYEDGTKRRLTLYVRKHGKDVQETSFRLAQEGKLSVFYWLDEKLGYALSGELDKSTLLALGDSVYQQLESKPVQ